MLSSVFQPLTLIAAVAVIKFKKATWHRTAVENSVSPFFLAFLPTFQHTFCFKRNLELLTTISSINLFIVKPFHHLTIASLFFCITEVFHHNPISPSYYFIRIEFHHYTILPSRNFTITILNYQTISSTILFIHDNNSSLYYFIPHYFFQLFISEYKFGLLI